MLDRAEMEETFTEHCSEYFRLPQPGCYIVNHACDKALPWRFV